MLLLHLNWFGYKIHCMRRMMGKEINFWIDPHKLSKTNSKLKGSNKLNGFFLQKLITLSTLLPHRL